jgi:hypothetical protein
MVDSEGGGAGVLLTETAMGRADNPTLEVGKACSMGGVACDDNAALGLALQDQNRTSVWAKRMRTPTLIIALMCCKTCICLP